MARGDRERGGPAGLDVEVGVAAERQGERSPLAHQVGAASPEPGARRWCSPRRGSNSTTASTGPPSAVSRRTSSVAGSRRPATSATMASVRVSRPSPTRPGRLQGGGVAAGTAAATTVAGPRGPTRNVPAAGPPTSRPKTGSPSKRGSTASRSAPSLETRAPRCGCRRAARSPRSVATSRTIGCAHDRRSRQWARQQEQPEQDARRRGGRRSRRRASGRRS